MEAVVEPPVQQNINTPRLRILLSYHYFKTHDLDDLFINKFGEPYPELFVDSGAFTAHSLGVDVDLHSYMLWIQRWRHWITTYVNLDVVRNPKATKYNQQRMEHAGLRPVPVFHYRSDWYFLEELIEKYPYIALGGFSEGGSKSSDLFTRWLLRCFRTASGRSVFHGFGVSNWHCLCTFPWYSVDSSSWAGGFRYGAIKIFDDRRGKWFSLDIGDVKGAHKHAKLLRTYDVEPGDVALRTRYHHMKIVAVCALSWVRAEVWLRKKHGVVYIPGTNQAGINVNLASQKTDAVERLPGIKHFLVSGTDYHLINMQNPGLKSHLSFTGTVPYHAGPINQGLKSYLATGRLDQTFPAQRHIQRLAHAG